MSTLLRRVLGLCALSAGLVACAEATHDTQAPTSESTGELVYGADDRIEAYNITSPIDARVAASTVALVDNSAVAWTGVDYQLALGSSFASSYNLCASEPFRDQPNPAYCSGFQVGPDLIATAGHCIDATSCGSTTFVFGFQMLDASTVRGRFASNDVYRCAEVVARAETSTLDYAVVRVDRAIVGHDALELRRSGTVASGTPVAVSGHPAGLPLKVAGGATVRGNSAADYFESNLDTYGGNSGSPVYDATTGVVEGILVRGNTDFVLTGRGRNRCYVSNTCSDAGCPGYEDVTRSTRFANFVPSGPACVTDAECDDGDPCTGFETCDAGRCVAGAAPSCDDGNACTTGSCAVVDATTWDCDSTAVVCDDGDACTVDLCDPATGCGSVPVACGAGEVCDGGDCVVVPACLPQGDACASDDACCSGRCHPRRGCR